MKRYLTALVPLALSACGGSPPQAWDNYGFEPQVEAVQECVVTAARQVQVIGSQPANNPPIGSAAAPRPIGTISGQRDTPVPSDDSYRLSGGVIGGAAPQAGNRPSMKNPPPMPASVEYRVREGDSERVIVQSIDYSGVVLPAGTPCRLVGSGSNTRVTWG